MADGVFISERLSTKCVIKKDVSRTITKSRRSRNRYFRRKRSKRNYWRTVRESRVRRESENSHRKVSVYNFTGMANDCFPQLPKEVSDWQYYHQLAYWKSRAISLEFENKVLHAHLKRTCAKEIQDYVDYAHGNTNDANSNNGSDERKSSRSEDEESKVGTVDSNLYGDDESKIRAMETAMDVNFKMQVENKKPIMWPNIPLNL